MRLEPKKKKIKNLQKIVDNILYICYTLYADRSKDLGPTAKEFRNMLKEEFENLVGKAVNDKDYSKIETVYTFHPSITNISGKREIAELYKKLWYACN